MLTACDSPSVTMPPATARRSTPKAHGRGCWYFHREGDSAAVPAGRGSWAGAGPPSLRRRPAITPPEGTSMVPGPARAGSDGDLAMGHAAPGAVTGARPRP